MLTQVGAESGCTECGRALAADARFCPFCGARVDTAVPEIRKVVTLLFCDVTGSTELGEQLDPEVLRGIMTRYFEIARNCVERHGGVVEKFVGDAVLAVFGVPDAREDDALRAVRAAAELRGELAELAADLRATTRADLQIRTGVNTGSVITGAGRAGGSFATGDAVNTAARLEQAARTGEILLGEMTYSLVRDAVVTEPVEPLILKGKAEPVTAHRLVEVLGVERGRRRPAAEVLVGRSSPRRTLLEAFERVTENNRLELVTVLGSAGMGKSTLIEHVLREVSASDEHAVILSGRCPSYGHGITFWPITQMIRQATGTAAGASSADVREALMRAFDGFPDAALATDRLLSLLGLEGEPGTRAEVFWAVRSLIEQLAERGPVLLAIDDLHWAEPMLLDLLDEVRDELRDAPVLLLVQARPELLENRSDWGTGSAHATTFSLDPLSTEQTADLLKSVTRSVPPDHVVRAIDGWAGGNPLYVVEVATHLLETGALTVGDDGWAVHADLSTITVPPGVTALLTARLDRLPGDERALLDRLSVIGLEFTPDDAHAVAAPGTDVDTLLSAMHRRDVLRRQRGASGVTWAFRHVLVREAAYESMPKAVRAEMHERFAGRLADATTSDAGAETAAFQAHHLEQAVRLRREISAPTAVLTTLTDRTVAALAAAADAAIATGNVVAAAGHLERALALIPPTDPRGRRMLLRAVELALQETQVAQAQRLADQLQAALSDADDDVPELERLAADVTTMWVALEAAEDIDPQVLVAQAGRLIEMGRSVDDNLIVGIGLWAATMSAATLGQWLTVGLLSEQSGAADPRLRSNAQIVVQASLLWGPTPVPEGLRALAAMPTEPSATPTQSFNAQLIRSSLLRYDGQIDAAALIVADLESTLRDAAPFTVASAGFVLSRYYIADGDHAAATRWLDRGIEATESTGSLSYASTLLAERARLALLAGADDEAAHLLDRAEAVTSRYDAVSVGLCAAGRSVIAARAGEQDASRALAERALEVIDTTDQIFERAEVRELLARAARAVGDDTRARSLLDGARELYAAKGVHPLVAIVDAELRALR